MGENQRLRAARKRRHWSQTQAAKACGVDLQTYFRWEHGTQEPHGYNLDRLCEVFSAPMEDLGYAHLIEVKMEEKTTSLLDDQDGSLMQLTSEQVAELLPLIGGTIVDRTKRDTLRAILAATGVTVAAPLLLVDPEPWERLSLATTTPAVMNQDTIKHFRGLLDTCRAFSNGSELTVAGGLLDTFLPKLQEVAPHQPEVAGLAAQGLQIKSILTAHNLHIADKITICRTAVQHAKQSNDSNLIAASLLQLGVAYHYAGQGDHALKAQQDALYHVTRTSPLVASHIYTELAATLAQFARGREAEFYINLAYEVFPQSPEQDPSFALDDHWFGNLALYKGIMYTHLTQPVAAWEAFEEHKKVSNIPERIRLEIINNQGKAALLANDIDKYAACLKEGLVGAIALKSKKRFTEALQVFQGVPAGWHKEPQLKPLIEQYML